MSNLREIRRARRLTLKDVARALGDAAEDHTGVSKDERNEARLTAPKLRQYAEALGCFCAEILGELPILSDEERQDVRIWAALPPDARARVIAVCAARDG